MGEDAAKMHLLWTIWGKRPEYGGNVNGNLYGAMIVALQFQAFLDIMITGIVVLISEMNSSQ